jgi:hypothetical protein
MGFKRIYLGITWDLPKIYLGFTGILLEFEWNFQGIKGCNRIVIQCRNLGEFNVPIFCEFNGDIFSA